MNLGLAVGVGERLISEDNVLGMMYALEVCKTMITDGTTTGVLFFFQ